MQAFKLTGLREMEIFTVPDPEIKNDTDVLVRMKTVGVCGSDIHYYTTGRIGTQVVSYPYAVGHEGAGVVEKVGSGVTSLKPGDKVAIEPAISCYECDQCKAGRYHTCRKLRFLGNPGEADGCLSEFIVMPERNLYPVSAPLDYEEATLSEPVSIGYYAVKQAAHHKNASIGILGSGPIGISVLLSAKTLGVGNIYVTDKVDNRLEMARKMGATWAGNPLKSDIVEDITQLEPLLLDVVYECCGQQEAIDQAIELLKPGGKLMIIGIPETDRWSFNVDKLRRKEITIINVRRQLECVEPVLKLMAERKLHSLSMITHRFPFSETKKAFDLVAGYEDGVMKAMIDFTLPVHFHSEH